MCDCDDSTPSCFREQYRAARKDHRCCECGAMIGKGERYRYSSGIHDGRAFNYRQCVQCGQVWDFEEEQARKGRFCGPLFTLLYDNLPRDEWPPHMVVAQDAIRAERAALRGGKSG